MANSAVQTIIWSQQSHLLARCGSRNLLRPSVEWDTWAADLNQFESNYGRFLDGGGWVRMLARFPESTHWVARETVFIAGASDCSPYITPLPLLLST